MAQVQPLYRANPLMENDNRSRILVVVKCLSVTFVFYIGKVLMYQWCFFSMRNDLSLALITDYDHLVARAHTITGTFQVDLNTQIWMFRLTSTHYVAPSTCEVVVLR